MNTSDFDYELPPELIAQEPLLRRDDSRMLVLHRQTGKLEHRTVRDLPDYMCEGDLMVINDTRVFPARVFGHREDTRGNVELLLLERCREVSANMRADNGSSRAGEAMEYNETWSALCRCGFKPRPGIVLKLAEGKIRADMLSHCVDGIVRISLASSMPLMDVLKSRGSVPVPPYIKRTPNLDLADLDRERYQTVYAQHVGAVAAPTAGLHFTPELLGDLANRGVRRASVTLHVGPGTFKPVTAESIHDHRMEEERYVVSKAAAMAVADARKNGKRVIGVGTTTVRTLETVASKNGRVTAGAGRSRLFVYPPYKFAVVDAMLTNFHLPKSTLIMLVSAFAAPGELAAGREVVLQAYREAVKERYRFYSYGDCMLIT